MIQTAEWVSAEKIRKIYEYHQKKINDMEKEIPIMTREIMAELELMESSEPQGLCEIFTNVKGGVGLIEKRLRESSEQFELY